MRLIDFDGLNVPRSNILMETFLRDIQDTHESPPTNTTLTTTTPAALSTAEQSPSLPTPHAIARREPLFFVSLLGRSRPSRAPIVRGVSFNELCNQRSTTQPVQGLIDSVIQNGYAVVLSSRRTRALWGRRHQVLISYSETATPETRLRAHLHAVLLGRASADSTAKGIDDVEAMASQSVQQQWPIFRQRCLDSGWDLDKTDLGSRGFELRFQ